eukprot:gnl/TRDRNA2_/TRDRNA2_196170_c0_seq1.p1 gnl/TRDRNA2_/TRDRNA2_196170_c0~~gnl/TRDRNA2_/TRDRNA2_196170_c0_seq1.p1  ORF type:complete len:259 (-),score=40.87 gnl/TRDRNA2_/TRDRNA2_196170_c0_seq1:163-939(-)
MPQRLLYEVLGVAQTASAAEIHRGYKLRALQVHPDKNPNDTGAKEAFQRLRHAYEILSDPQQRRQYDSLGDVQSGSDGCTADSLRELIRTRFRPVSADEIADFTRSYRGSADERCDVAAFVRERKGDVSQLLAYIICSEPGDVDRFVELIEQLMNTGEVPADLRTSVTSSIPKLRRAASTLARRNKRERKELSEGAGLEDLARQIRGKQQQRQWASSIAEMLETKYCTGDASTTRAVKRRPAAAAASAGARVRSAKKE